MAKLSSRSATSTTTSDRVNKTIDSTSNLINSQHQTNIDVDDLRNSTSRHSTSQAFATTYLVLGEPDEENNGDFSSERAAKRRKISTRDSKQSTLDTFLGQPAHAPLKIVQKEPGGKLVEQINGVRHELSLNAADIGNRQNVNKPVKKVKQVETVKRQEDKRTLRSQDDGPRVKSDLATYFPNYEEVLFPTEKQAELLDVNTVLYISDTATKKNESSSPVRSIKSRSPTARRASPVQASPSSQNANILDLTSVSNFITVHGEDPLTDDVFAASHRRAERKEKQMRNIEREHAMHEKSQLERLLDGLLGHDWLKVLGITGVTETEGKKFESKRQYFIDEVRALINKFEEYRKEEKRQKRDAANAAQRAADYDDEDESEISSSGARSADLNESASRQLQQETAIAMKSQNRSKTKERVIVPERPPSPITSFFESRHKRETALNKNRTSRNTAAFGQPLPEPEEREFALPAEYLTADVLRASARERRRRNRESAVNARSRPP